MIVWCTLLGIAWTVQTLPNLRISSGARQFFVTSLNWVYVWCVCVYTSDLIGRSMTTSPPVLSPGSILQPLAPQCVSFPSRQILTRISKTLLHFFFVLYKFCINRGMSLCQCVQWPREIILLLGQCSFFTTIWGNMHGAKGLLKPFCCVNCVL